MSELHELKNNVLMTQKELGHIKDRLNDIPTRQEMRADNLALVEEVIKKTDAKYAKKDVEKIVYGGIGVGGFYILTQLFDLL